MFTAWVRASGLGLGGGHRTLISWVSLYKKCGFRAAECSSLLPVSAKDQVKILFTKRKYALYAKNADSLKTWLKINKLTEVARYKSNT